MQTLTPAQRLLIKLDNQKEEVKKFYEDLQVVLKEVATEIGVDGMFQDPETGIVYQIVKPDGRYVHYEALTCNRTRKEGETRGSLSLTKAKDAGFDL